MPKSATWNYFPIFDVNTVYRVSNFSYFNKSKYVALICITCVITSYCYIVRSHLSPTTQLFLAAFAKLRKATIIFVKYLRLRIRTRLPLDGFSWKLIWAFFENLSRKFKFYWNVTRITDTLHEDYVHLQYLDQFFLEWEMLQTTVVEKIKTQNIFNNVFRKIVLCMK